MNILLRKQYISDIRERAINSFVSSSAQDIKDLDGFLNYMQKNYEGLGFVGWGGLLTFKRKIRKLLISPFHNTKNQSIFQKLNQRIKDLPDSPLMKKACQDLFFASSLKSVSFNKNLRYLFGLEQDDVALTSNPIKPDDIELNSDMNYFRCLQLDLANSYDTDIPFLLELMKTQPLRVTKMHEPSLAIRGIYIKSEVFFLGE